MTTLRRDEGYHLDFHRRLLRETHPEAQPHSFLGRTRACHPPLLRAQTSERLRGWKVMPCGRLCPLKWESVGSKFSSQHCEGSHLLTVRLADVMSEMALSWKDPSWAAKGLSVDLGSDPTLVETKEGKLPNIRYISPYHRTSWLVESMSPW